MGAIAPLIIAAVEELIKLAPGLVTEFQTIFNKSAITPADWAALRAKVASKSYADYVPQSDIPKS